MSDTNDYWTRDDGEVPLDDGGFAIGSSDALQPRFEPAVVATPMRTNQGREMKGSGVIRLPAATNTVRRKGSGDTRSPNQGTRGTIRKNLSPPGNRGLHQSLLGGTQVIQGAKSNPRMGSPSAQESTIGTINGNFVNPARHYKAPAAILLAKQQAEINEANKNASQKLSSILQSVPKQQEAARQSVALTDKESMSKAKSFRSFEGNARSFERVNQIVDQLP